MNCDAKMKSREFKISSGKDDTEFGIFDYGDKYFVTYIFEGVEVFSIELRKREYQVLRYLLSRI